MFGFIKKVFFVAIPFFSCNALKSGSINNQESRGRPEVININSNEALFYSYSILAFIHYSYSIHPFAKLCIPYVVKGINIKLFNLMLRTNEARYIEWHKTCRCKCRLDASVCNNKQRWNKDRCRCECKELIDKIICDKGFISNPSNCDCECDKSCNVGECLDHKNCKCRNKLVNKLIEECIENIDANEMIYNETLNKNVCNSCTIYIVLFVIFLITSLSICSVFIYFHSYLKRRYIETTIY